MNAFGIPVALFFFNRPQKLAQVFAQVRKIQPSQLFLIQDGARSNRPEDSEKILECRQVVGQIDWACEVVHNFSSTNLGAGRRVASGISWVFEQVEQAIILEDDCVPDLSFFPFCEAMLQRYADDERVMMISGANYVPDYQPLDQASYLFSKASVIHGWATWRRAWALNDFELQLWRDPIIRQMVIDEIGDPYMQRVSGLNWDRVVKQLEAGGHISCWDYQWSFALYAHGGLDIVPKHQLIRNIGWMDGTHTNLKHERQLKPFMKIPTQALEEDYIHPQHMVCDRAYDRQFFRLIHRRAPLYRRWGSVVKRMILKQLGRKSA